MKVGFVGIGRIGSVMAANVKRANFDLMVYDLRPEATEELRRMGASVADSPMQVGEFAEIVEIAVRDDPQVEEVIVGERGLLKTLKPGSIIIIHSTIDPETAIKMGEYAAKKGVSVVDAPMSGGSEGAAARTLLYMVGAEPELFERCRPLFETSGKTIVRMGPLGSGAKTRIVHHVIMALNRLAADEGLRLAQGLGLDIPTVCKAVHGGEAQSHIVDRYLEKYRDMTTGGQYRIAGMALRMSNQMGLPMVGPALFQQLYLPKKDDRWPIKFRPTSP